MASKTKCKNNYKKTVEKNASIQKQKSADRGDLT